MYLKLHINYFLDPTVHIRVKFLEAHQSYVNDYLDIIKKPTRFVKEKEVPL